jgi:hypothetical protein
MIKATGAIVFLKASPQKLDTGKQSGHWRPEKIGRRILSKMESLSQLAGDIGLVCLAVTQG